MLSEFKQVFFLELVNFISSLNLVSVARRLNRKRVVKIKVSMATQPCTVLFVLLIAKLAVLELKVSACIIKNHGKLFNRILFFDVFNHGTEDED